MFRKLLQISFGFAGGIWLAASWVLPAALIMLIMVSLILFLSKRQASTMLLAALCGCLWLFIMTPVWPGGYGPSIAKMRVETVESGPKSQTLGVRLLAVGGKSLPLWNKVGANVTIMGLHDIVEGDILEGPLQWEPSPGPKNPGEFDYAAYLSRRGILATAFVEDFSVLSHGQSPRWLAGLRRKLQLRATLLPGAAGELLATLTLGGKAGLWAQTWRDSGLAHVLSISGMHIGLLLAALWAILRLVRMPPKVANGLVALCLLLYGIILGPRPAVWRAIIMAWMGLLADATHRVRDWPNALALAALILLVLNPWYLWDAGWQLSFAATAGIFFFSPLIKERLPILPFKLDWLLSAGLAAQLATLPLVLYHFYLITPLALFFNIILAPFIQLALVVGLLYLLLPWAVGRLLLPGLRLLYGCLLTLVDSFASLPGAKFSPGAPSLVLVFLYILFLVAFFHGSFRKRRWAGMAWVLTCLLLLAGQPLGRWLANTHNFTVLSVGQGSCAALHLPGGDAILFDAGGGHDAIGRQIIVPYLRYRGTGRLDIYLSHLHADHINGLVDVLQSFQVRKLYLPATCLQTAAYGELEPLLNQRRVQVEDWSLGGQRIYRSLKVEAINPCPGPPQDENEDSLVLILTWPNLKILLPGDIGAREEALLPYLPQALDILLVPHHGSAKSSSDAFLQVLQPKEAIISCGPNLYGHPSRAALERLTIHGERVWRTDEHGAVSIYNSHRGYRIAPFLRGKRGVLK